MSSEASDDDEKLYREALKMMESGVESAKTKVAFYRLSGRGGAEIDAKGSVSLLEDRAKELDGEALWMLGLCCEYGIGTEQAVNVQFCFTNSPRKEEIVLESCF